MLVSLQVSLLKNKSCNNDWINDDCDDKEIIDDGDGSLELINKQY